LITRPALHADMHIQARRVFRLSGVTATSLACAYALQLPLAFLAPVLALLITATPGPPIGLKGLLGLVVVSGVTMGVGLLLIPLLLHYPVSALLLAGLGLYLSFYLTVNLGKGLVGAFLTIGITLVSAAGLVNFGLAVEVIKSLIIGLGIAIASQWIVYPFFPEDPGAAARPATPAGATQSTWIAMRATLIVMPVYFIALSNPALYLATIMKTVSLSQQCTLVSARGAGWELLGSTFLAGVLAIVFWCLLGIWTNLWMFFWLMLLFGIYFSSKIYQFVRSRFTPSFWINVGVTMLILVGPAVADSDSGKDVYMAFFIRMTLFVGVTLYAWLAVYTLEALRARRISPASGTVSPTC
jgi:hypothetical protein